MKVSRRSRLTDVRSRMWQQDQLQVTKMDEQMVYALAFSCSRKWQPPVPNHRHTQLDRRNLVM